MKRFILAALAAACMLPAAFAASPVAYRLFDNAGREVDFDAMADSLGRADVVFIGENHNCPISHWFEQEITRALHKIHGPRLVLGEEMMEADNQLILDEYLSRKISFDRFEAEARLWDNFSTDYYPVVYYAKDNGLPFVATNVPRRYAAAVNEGGLAVLDSLSAEAKRYLPPLPVSFSYDEDETAGKFGAMAMLSRRSPEQMRRMAEAQALKDATMAWFIARNLTGPFLHINGSFHSDCRGGIIPYLEQYKPGLRIATVTSVRQDEIDTLDPDNRDRADFYIVVPTDFPTSY